MDLYKYNVFFSFFHSDIPDLQVWTSTLVRTHQTAANVPAPKLSFKELNEIDAGSFDGMTYDEVAERFPEEFKARGCDKLNYRYPKGKILGPLNNSVIGIENQFYIYRGILH